MRYTNESLTMQGMDVKQVNKTKARKDFKAGHIIFMNACNMRSSSLWTSPAQMINSAPKESIYPDPTFDAQVNSFEYYNCNNKMGKYANFFTTNI